MRVAAATMLFVFMIALDAHGQVAQEGAGVAQPGPAKLGVPATVGIGDRTGKWAAPQILPPQTEAGASQAAGVPVPPLPVHKPQTPADETAEADGAEPKAAKPTKVAAKMLFGHAGQPAALPPKAIGFYSRGCLAGGSALPVDGEVWQAMRLSRNRNWAHPRMVALVKRLAEDAAAKDGWPGLLVGDMSQPRGGPMLTGHNSHQVGLDADIWLTPMPDRRLSYKERETMSAVSMLAPDQIHADPKVFTSYHAGLIRRAASYPEVERIFVHPGIKKAMCEEKGVDRQHFNKIRPYWGHHYHMHIRIGCPPGSDNCRAQVTIGGDDGCGKEIDDWIALVKKRLAPQPPTPPDKTKPRKPRPPITLADLPAECSAVIAADKPGDTPQAAQAKSIATQSGK